MGKLNIELCPETGICSIVKSDGTKVDLMPDEVDSLRAIATQPDAVRKTIADVDANFAQTLQPEDLKQLAEKLR